MAYLEQEGPAELKPIAWSKWETTADGCIGLKFDFVDSEGRQCSGAFGWTKRDGSENENIQIFSDAFEQGKFVTCEVAKGQPKKSGSHFYKVKWAITGGSANASTSKADLAKFLAERATMAKSAPEQSDDEVPF